MPILRETDEAFNQPPPLEDTDLFASDPSLAEAVAAFGGKIGRAHV